MRRYSWDYPEITYEPPKSYKWEDSPLSDLINGMMPNRKVTSLGTKVVGICTVHGDVYPRRFYIKHYVHKLWRALKQDGIHLPNPARTEMGKWMEEYMSYCEDSEPIAPPSGDAWMPQWTIERREGDWTAEQIESGLAPEPYEVTTHSGIVLDALKRILERSRLQSSVLGE